MIIEFIETNEQYHNGVALEEYNGIFSIVRSYRNKEGDIAMKWGYPDIRKAPAEKAIPWKVELGTQEQAVSILQKLLDQFGGTAQQTDDEEPPPF